MALWSGAHGSVLSWGLAGSSTALGTLQARASLCHLQGRSLLVAPLLLTLLWCWPPSCPTTKDEMLTVYQENFVEQQYLQHGVSLRWGAALTGGVAVCVHHGAMQQASKACVAVPRK
jgi:hypothetical protein